MVLQLSLSNTHIRSGAQEQEPDSSTRQIRNSLVATRTKSFASVTQHGGVSTAMTVKLTGPRLMLREFSPDDWEAVYAFTSRPEVSRYQAWGPNTPEDAQTYVGRACAAALEKPRSTYILAVVQAETAQVVTRWRLAAVMTILGQPRFQVLHPCLQGSILRQHEIQLVLLLRNNPLEFGNADCCCHAHHATLQRKSV